jgi:hypothetical protein
MGEKLDRADHASRLARSTERHPPDRVSAIRPQAVRANVYRFGHEGFPVRCALPRIAVALDWTFPELEAALELIGLLALAYLPDVLSILSATEELSLPG